jgi:hypothetical protein
VADGEPDPEAGRPAVTRICKVCPKPIDDKSRSKYCAACRGPSTHNIKPTIRIFTKAP